MKIEERWDERDKRQEIQGREKRRKERNKR